MKPAQPYSHHWEKVPDVAVWRAACLCLGEEPRKGLAGENKIYVGVLKRLKVAAADGEIPIVRWDQREPDSLSLAIVRMEDVVRYMRGDPDFVFGKRLGKPPSTKKAAQAMKAWLIDDQQGLHAGEKFGGAERIAYLREHFDAEISRSLAREAYKSVPDRLKRKGGRPRKDTSA
jgi:hypothetical protein